MHETLSVEPSARPHLPELAVALRTSHWTMTLDGIALAADNPSFVYDPWLKLPEKEELREALKQGVSCVLDRYANNQDAARYVRDNIYDLSRAGWQAVCPLRRDSVVLDMGCGLGALARSLARNCGSIVGLDACYQRLMIHHAVNRELGFDNIRLLCGSHTSIEEFSEGSFDGIILNGILEWIPEMADGDPGAVQLAFLRQCRRVLKEDGWLYLGIENRWGYRYFLDRPEEHANLMYASLLPRPLASLWSRLMRKKPYRTYTYSPAGYARLMKEAGFAGTSVYGTLPDYRNFSILRPLADTRRVRGAARCFGVTKRWKQWIVESPSFFRRFVPSVGVVAHCRLDAPAPVWFDNANGHGLTVEQIYVKPDQASFWYETENGQSRIRELALSTGAVRKLRHIAALAQGLRDTPQLPAALADWHLAGKNGFVWADRRTVSGKILEEVPAQQRPDYLPRICEAIRRIHSASKHLNWSTESLADQLDSLIPYPAKVGDARVFDSLRKIAAHLDQRWQGLRILMHGDCTPLNTIIAGSDIQFIDWEWSRVVSFAGYDILKLIWFENENPVQRPCVWDENVFRARLEEAETRHAFELVHPGADWEMGVFTYWAVRMFREVGMFANGGLSPDWIRQIVRPSVEAAQSLLGL